MPQESLMDLLPENRTKVVLVTDAKQVDDTKKNVKMVGANWCSFSKIGISQQNDACTDLQNSEKGAVCYTFDVTNPASEKAAKDLGLKFDGFPTFFFNDGKGKQAPLVGMRPSRVLKKEMAAFGFKV